MSDYLGIMLVFGGLPAIYVALWAVCRIVHNKFPRSF